MATGPSLPKLPPLTPPPTATATSPATATPPTGTSSTAAKTPPARKRSRAARTMPAGNAGNNPAQTQPPARMSLPSWNTIKNWIIVVFVVVLVVVGLAFFKYLTANDGKKEKPPESSEKEKTLSERLKEAKDERAKLDKDLKAANELMAIEKDMEVKKKALARLEGITEPAVVAEKPAAVVEKPSPTPSAPRAEAPATCAPAPLEPRTFTRPSRSPSPRPTDYSDPALGLGEDSPRVKEAKKLLNRMANTCDSVENRAQAIVDLSEYRYYFVANNLKEAVRGDENWNLRCLAVSSMGKILSSALPRDLITSEVVRKAFIPFLEDTEKRDSSPQVRAEAKEAIRKIKACLKD